MCMRAVRCLMSGSQPSGCGPCDVVILAAWTALTKDRRPGSLSSPTQAKSGSLRHTEVMATQRLSTMVAVGSDPRSGAAEQLQKAAGPTTYELRKPGRPINQWHPRATPKGRDVWSDEVGEHMRTCVPIVPNYILEGPPTMKRVTTALPKASKEELEAAFAASMMEYQAYNTALYDAIDPSILFNGAYETVDRLQRKEFANGDLRDGVGLYNYVRDLTRRDPIEQQIEAMRALATHGVLSADKNVTQVQFDRHVNGLLAKWTDVNLDAAANVADFRNRLIASLPDEPLTSKVVLIRIYLVDACNANQEETKTVQGLVRLVTKRGRELGLPAGSVLDEIVAPVIEKDKRDKKDGGKTQDQKPGDASNLNVKSTRRPRAGENEDHGAWTGSG